ncbi:MAG: OadG family protein [Clostridia bacterium]|nr:OadG family protein [Clostridia bacterium]
MLNMKTALTADIGILEAGVTALLGYAVVFVGLILLMWVVMGLGKVMTAKTAKPAAAPAPEVKAEPVAEEPKAEAKGTAGTILLHDVPEREAAMVMAVVAHRLGKPLNQLRFKSIREVKDK